MKFVLSSPTSPLSFTMYSLNKSTWADIDIAACLLYKETKLVNNQTCFIFIISCSFTNIINWFKNIRDNDSLKIDLIDGLC